MGFYDILVKQRWWPKYFILSTPPGWPLSRYVSKPHLFSSVLFKCLHFSTVCIITLCKLQFCLLLSTVCITLCKHQSYLLILTGRLQWVISCHLDCLFTWKMFKWTFFDLRLTMMCLGNRLVHLYRHVLDPKIDFSCFKGYYGVDRFFYSTVPRSLVALINLFFKRAGVLRLRHPPASPHILNQYPLRQSPALFQ